MNKRLQEEIDFWSRIDAAAKIVEDYISKNAATFVLENDKAEQPKRMRSGSNYCHCFPLRTMIYITQVGQVQKTIGLQTGGEC